jgi:hypothetical protein
MYESGELHKVLGIDRPAGAPEHAPVAAEPGAPPLQIDTNLVDHS